MIKFEDRLTTIKPAIREILWAYKKDKDLGKAVDRFSELLEDIWDLAKKAK